MTITWRDLKERANEQPESQLDTPVEVLLNNEFIPVQGLGINPEPGDMDHYEEIDVGQPYLFI